MHVVGCRDNHSVDVLLLVEHFAAVFPLAGVGKFFERARGVTPIDVAQRDNVVVWELRYVTAALTGHADARDVQFFAGGGLSAQPEDRARDNVESRHGKAGGAQKITARKFVDARFGLHDRWFDVNRAKIYSDRYRN